MIIDLHCHSHFSDGSLSPQELLEQAQLNNIDIFSITDHDNINAYHELKNIQSSTKIISGIEFSTTWRKIGIHIVGLNFDLAAKSLASAVDFYKKSRIDRAQLISNKLEKIGLENGFKKLYKKDKQIGRPDFAHLLIKESIVQNWNQAFKKYLGAGKIGDVKCQWLGFEDIINTIKDSFGHAVLAHPLHYGLTNSKLMQLFAEFSDAGGEGIEVLNGYQNPHKTQYLIKACQKFNLKASVGSDFHQPSQHKKLGCQTSWIKNVDCIWENF